MIQNILENNNLVSVETNIYYYLQLTDAKKEKE